MDSQGFFFQTANKIQGSTMQQMKTLKPVWTYLTSLETAHKFMNVIGLFATKKKTWEKTCCDWIIFFQVPRFE